MTTRTSRVTERTRRSAISNYSINGNDYRNSPLGRARRELAFAKDDLRVAQHRLALAYVSIYPYTWSPEVDEAVRELSRAHRAHKAAKDAVTRAERHAKRDALEIQR